ncbi:MAG: hypothetical protein Q9157_001292 [Trypethelium eluteriae]
MAPTESENIVIEDFRRHTDPERPRKDVWCPNSNFEKSDELDFFVPKNQLKEYFDRHLEEILSALSEDIGIRFVEPRLIRDGYLKIFAILLRIRREAWIQYFLNFPSLNDNKLPFEVKPHDFPVVTEDDRFFWTSFNKCQWMFCAPEVRYTPRCKWNTQIVLPIIFKERIASGRSADTYKIRIHPDYNHLHRNNMVRLKEILAYEAVRRSFDGRTESGIIGFYGSFEHREAFNVILEYANHDTLEEYMTTLPPPMKTEDIFLWHQDIRPTNILCQLSEGQSPYQCMFKLADLGLSHLIDYEQESHMALDNSGARIYSAPEAYRADSITGRCDRVVSEKADVWSLGCILAEAAVWIITGRLGLEDFRNRRAKMNSTLQGLGCFHDGLKLLGLVDKTLKDLIEYRRISDPVTDRLIPLILKMLWRETPRPYARDLWIEARSVLEVSRQGSIASPSSQRSLESISTVHPLDPPTPERIPSHGKSEWRDVSYDINGKIAILPTQNSQTNSSGLEDSQRSPPSLPTSQGSSEFSSTGRRSITELISPGGLDKAMTTSPKRESLFPMIQQTPPDMRGLARLIDFDGDVDERNENGQTPIMVAADMGDFKVVKLLLGKARLDIQDKLGQTLLHQIPKKHGGEDMLEMILSHARVNGRHIEVNAAGIGGRTPLHEAVRAGKSKAIRLLIEHGANVNSRDNRRTLPSTIAIEGEKVMALEYLLKYDCKIDPDQADRREISKDIKWMLKRYQKLPKKK